MKRWHEQLQREALENAWHGDTTNLSRLGYWQRPEVPGLPGYLLSIALSLNK